MREIGKYRGQRKDNGEWVYGFLFKIWEQAYILWGTTNGIPNMIEVIPETVCEHIRRLDKNGVKIYEDDKWRLSGKTFIVKYGESRPYESGEVIGNIHKDPN